MQTSLRKMGNSTGLIVPKAILDQLGLACGARIDLRVEDGRVIAEPVRRPLRAGWAEDAARIGAAGPTAEEAAWLDADDPVDGECEW